MPSNGGPHGRKSPAHTPQRSPMVRAAQTPPSPEYSNLDCAFPPFPIKTPRNPALAQQPTNPNPQLENDYTREQAESYNQSRPGSPYSMDNSRPRFARSFKSGNSSGILGGRPSVISRPSTANGARRPSLASISGGPKFPQEERPPLPASAIASAAPLAAPKPRRAGFVGLKLDSSQRGGLPSQTPQQRPLSPNRTQTFPLHNEDRISGNGPNSFIARRPSQPLPTSSMGRPPPTADSTSLRSLRERGPGFRANPPSNQNAPSQMQVNKYPPRAASRNGNRPVPGNRPFPVRNTSRTSVQDDCTTSSHPHLPAQTPTGNSDVGDRSDTTPESESSYATGASGAHTGTLHSSPPQAKQFSNRQRTGNESHAPYAPLPALSLPPQPSLSSVPPESPTDPLCYQGRLSPLPRASIDSPFSTPSSSSTSSRDSSRNQSVQDPPDGQRKSGANKGLCRGCSQPILAGQKSISSKDGRLTGRYHKQCFACNTCQSPFETADFYVHDDHPFCAKHYHALNGSLCNSCGQGIEGQYLAATNTKEQGAEKFHPNCLTCSTCRVSLQNDYFEWNGKAYCERDATQAAGVSMQLPSDALLSPGRNPSPGSDLSSKPSPSRRPGLPTGPRAGLRPPGPGLSFGSANGFLAPFPASGGPQASVTGRRFPERRTTKLMMI